MYYIYLYVIACVYFHKRNSNLVNMCSLTSRAKHVKHVNVTDCRVKKLCILCVHFSEKCQCGTLLCKKKTFIMLRVNLGELVYPITLCM